MAKVELENVSFGYDANTPVIRNINLVLEGSGLICVIGPNGVGKSTLVKCINKLVHPNEGRVLLNGVDVSKMKRQEIAKIVGYVPVRSEDTFAMNVADTILIGRHSRSKWRTTEEDILAAEEVMLLLGIEDLAMRSFNELSAGQHQKVSIARGLVQDPSILILDEPTSNLDIRHQIYVAQLLRAVAVESDMMIIMISHDINIASKYANQVILMAHPGEVYCQGASEDVITVENLRDVYGVNCRIIDDEGKPYVILNSDLPPSTDRRKTVESSNSSCVGSEVNQTV